ncbi:hypothetical protein [Oenococcus oeni]|uniref:Uncharacterized protein n=3 Tax=Oenococcus oeni TaxID=1247 RepID=Q04EE5_OENOB|nr:hypothetical protein [Oenococcus oeni]KGO16140.1 hypothetical protein OA32_06830 [Oenococcus oeni X2L]ABJ57177.1 hypothetical protein OEOE_1305 [Oenococcus oeni PSU-1]EFD88158.1 hypothetical protein AWRIB429_1305 [Oenococcus oeni AWRIB429]EJN92698.1 hypothetical protein AWRIB304_570 [Oenococcus oeni AWRIB304]EJN99929.1 hypothetical protein AWRIB318_1467 [Oenococcus oeni AWRIB318]
MQKKKMRWKKILLIGNCHALIEHFTNIVQEYRFAVLWKLFGGRAHRLCLLTNTNQRLFGSKVPFKSLDVWIYENKI